MKEVAELLKRNPLFSGLDEAGLDKVKGITTLHFYKKGSILFSQGDGAHGFYLVTEGKIKIYRLSPNGQEYVMRLVGPGETIAEAAVFSGKTYPASAEALEDSRLYYLNKSDFTSPHPRESPTGPEYDDRSIPFVKGFGPTGGRSFFKGSLGPSGPFSD